MDLVEKGISDWLATVAGLTALVSDRIYPGQLGEDCDTFPAVAYFSVGESPVQMQDGGAAGLTFQRFQFDALADDPLTAKNVAEQIRQAVHGFDRQVGSVLQSMQWLGRRDLPHDIATATHGVASEVRIAHQQECAL